jgi:hypothetical protein
VENSAVVAMFPWRQLGALLVDEELLTPTELELALDEQRRTGRLLGQIIVDRGYLSTFSLARMLSAQHGLELQKAELAPAATWRPLGRLLVDKRLITEPELEQALLAQKDDRRLGEILVERGLISGSELARVLSEQHGLELTGNVTASLKPAVQAEPVYRVYKVTFRQGFQSRTSLCESRNLLDAADFAMDYVQDNEPQALEIERLDGDLQETVWTYSESRAEAAVLARKDLVETFGFDPTKWDPNR